jgi:AcrR family transcriptional regulator
MPEPSTTARLTPDRRRQLTKDALLDAAAAVFSQRGFYGASLDEIAETAGFTRGAIYKNYGGKEDLFLALFDREIDRNLATVREAFAEENSIGSRDADRMAAIWLQVLGRDRDRFALHLEFQLFAIRNAEVRERYAAFQRKSRQTIAKFIEDQAVTAGITIAVPTVTLAALVDAASHGFQGSTYIDEGDADLFASFLELLIPAVIADAAAPTPTKRGRPKPARR